MNCKPGDLAVVVKGNKDCPFWDFLVGRIFKLTTLVPSKRYSTPSWGYKGEVVIHPYKSIYLIGFRDECLRPIRDTPGEDETLQWAPVPGERVTA